MRLGGPAPEELVEWSGKIRVLLGTTEERSGGVQTVRSHRRMKSTGGWKGMSSRTDSSWERGNVSFLLGPWAGSSANRTKDQRREVPGRETSLL